MKLRFIGATTANTEGIGLKFSGYFFFQLLQKLLTELKFWRALLQNCWNDWPQIFETYFSFLCLKLLASKLLSFNTNFEAVSLYNKYVLLYILGN